MVVPRQVEHHTDRVAALKDDGKSLLLAQIYCLAAAAAMKREIGSRG